MLRDAVARWHSRGRHALILLYHRVTHLPNDRWSIAVTPEHFDEHMALVRRRSNVVPLSGLDAALAAPNARTMTIAVTFDDGYADNLYEALPILQRHDVPATVFVASDPIVRAREFWWDDLERLVDSAEYDGIWTRLRDVDAREREAMLETLRSAADIQHAPRSAYRPLPRRAWAGVTACALGSAHTPHRTAQGVDPGRAACRNRSGQGRAGVHFIGGRRGLRVSVGRRVALPVCVVREADLHAPA